MDSSRLTAAVLAGGQGVRLRSAVADRPKVLAPVAGRPFLAYLLDGLARAGVGRTVLCTGYRAGQVEEAFGNSHQGMELRYSPEESPLGTGGALRHARSLLDSEPVLVLNGDSYCGYTLKPFLAWHRHRRSAATLWLTEVRDPRRFGRVQVAPDGTVRRFVEKADAADSPSANGMGGWINAGVYLLSQPVLDSIPEGKAVSLERDTFPAWVGRGLHGYRANVPFLDIGTPESYARAEAFLAGLVGPGTGERRSVPDGGGRRRRFVLLDRDGVVIAERNYLSDPGQVELLPGVVEGLRRLRDLGLGLVIVTNQSGVGRGYFDPARVGEVHDRLRELLAAGGVTVDGIYTCPHAPEDGCACRKPLGALGRLAAEELGFDPREAFVVGDKKCDLDFGRGLGAVTILVLTGYGDQARNDPSVQPDYVARDLNEAAAMIEAAVAGTGRAGNA